MTIARVGDIQVGYDVTGDGNDWVLLITGFAWARWGWNWQVPTLSKSFRTIVFDNRGIGETTAAPPYTIEQMATDSAGLLDTLGIERAHVVGVSMGGCVAMQLAIAHPDRVGRLVLLATSLGGACERSYPIHERALRIIQESASLPEEERLRAGVENSLGEHGVATRPDLVEELVRLRLETAQPLEHWAAQATAYPAYDAGARASGITAETMVATGTDDTFVDPRNSKLLAEEIPGARLFEMPGGHLSFIQHADQFNPLLERFLKTGDV